MEPEERIIRDAIAVAMRSGTQYGAGGRAAAKLYTEGMLNDPEVMLFTLAIMANGLAHREG